MFTQDLCASEQSSRFRLWTPRRGSRTHCWLGAPLQLKAFDKDHFCPGGAMAHFARLPVILAIEPPLWALGRFEFKHDDALWFPIAFECLRGAPTHDVFAAVFLHRRAGKLLVFFVTDRIDNVDFDYPVRRHR